CAASGVSLPAAGATRNEAPRPQICYPKQPDVSGHGLESGGTHHAPTKHPELRIMALNELLSLTGSDCVRLKLVHVSNSWPSYPNSYLLTGPHCAPQQCVYCRIAGRHTAA
ncbi:hypothetical protein KUCAC02_024442, partial [Chaenocephalus aceratus]